MINKEEIKVVDIDEIEISNKLDEVAANAYSPYYKFHVACCVVTNDNNKYYGVNVENANGTSICAERNAIAAAICDGKRKGDFKKIYIKFGNKEFGTPCFACRQVILEFFEKDKLVISLSKDTKKEYTVEELCPYSFSSDDLSK